MLTQQGTKCWGQWITASLNQERTKRADNVTCSIEGHFKSGDLKEAWCCLKGWYTVASVMPPKACHNSTDKQTAEREELYWKASHPGNPIPIDAETFDLDDLIPEDAEIRVLAAVLRNGRAEGSGRVRAEHMKTWLCGTIEDEDNGKENTGDLWQLLFRLVQAIWDKGEIPQQMLWMVVILLPKGGGDFRGIGLLKPF